jgi:hypothetical protein
MFAKIKLDCSNDRTTAALQKFIQCELEVGDDDWYFQLSDKLDFDRICHLLGRDLWSELDRKVWRGEFMPKHGTGSTASGTIGNAKYLHREWTNRLESLFPFVGTVTASWSQYDTSHVTFHEPGQEPPAKVITVPKTLETPRVIAMEPVHMQYVQQGLHELIVEGYERDELLSHFIRYDGAGSQEINQRLARQGSIDGSLATLDLSEASDRVSNSLVKAMLTRFPHFGEAVQASRSQRAVIPELGVTLELKKFASMGSALCFPMEALVFLTVVFVGIEKCLGHQLSRKDLKSFVGRVRIYGDDIVVPVEYVQSVIESLEAFGFVVGKNKSFWTGRFRESCGKDWYAGTDVSIVRMRNEFPTSRTDAEGLESIVSLRNQLYLAGFDAPVKWLDCYIKGIIPFPFVEITSPVLGRLRPEGHQTDGYDRDLQQPLVLGAVTSGPLPLNEISGYEALLKHFLKRGSQPILDPEHLERSGRPQRVRIKVGMGPAT